MATYKLGFRTLAKALGQAIVGTPLEDERYQANGDSIQRTTDGLMVWRKADNWTAFTDGYNTWVNGPFGVQQRLNSERFDWEAEPAELPAPAPRRFAVWNGTTISPSYSQMLHIALEIAGLQPPGDWRMEWLVKAGEGGTWQAAWDSHPMAISGPDKLRELYLEGQNVGVGVVPYFVIRGRPSWTPAEIEQVAQAAAITGRVVLNLEPGDYYWNGPTEAQALVDGYLAPLRQRVNQLSAETAGEREGPIVIQLAAIPRQWVIDALGGQNDVGTGVLETWARFVNAMSWECYDAIAPDLDVAESMERVRGWLADVPEAQGPAHTIPIVQRSRIAAWAGTPYADGGLEVWHLDGD